MSKSSEEKFVADMLQYAREALQIATSVDGTQFNADRKLQLALAHLVQTVGEAAYRTRNETRAMFPDVPWNDIIGMRHRLVHDYGNVSYSLVWETVTRDLPPLIAALEKFTPPEPPLA